MGEKLIYEEEEISKNTNNLKKVTSIVSVILKTDIAINKIQKQIDDIYSILHSSDSDKLSRHSISISDLRNIIRKIENKGGRETPLFDSMNTNMYFTQKLAHSWLTEETDKLVTILQIPMMDHSTTYVLELIESKKQSNADLPMVVRNEQDNTYRYLSNSDYVNCQDVLNSKLCQKRPIKIFPTDTCQRADECDEWTAIVVHDITNTKIIVQTPKSNDATISCDRKQNQIMHIPAVALVTLPIHCQLVTDSFVVSRLSFRHLFSHESNDIEDDVDLHVEEAILTASPAKVIDNFMQSMGDSLEQLKLDNENLGKDIHSQKVGYDEKWKQVSGGMTAWEQILMWSLTGVALGLTILLGVCVLRIWLRVKIQEGGGEGVAKATRKAIRELKSRLIDIETDLRINETTLPRTSTPIEERTIEEDEEEEEKNE